MGQLDDLLARSRDPGAFKDRRHFTLARKKAIEKQREFALRDPKQYVLEIIQGAVFAGATYMAIDSRKHDILIAWVGAPPLQRAHLENLFDYLFADRSDKRIRHMVQLAVGINAILQRKPKAIRLESGDGQTSIRLDLDAEGEADIGEVERPIDGTYLVAEFSGGWLGRWAPESKWTRVAPLVEERCLYTPVPILLNGNAPFGFRASRNIEIFGARDQEQFDHGDRRGVIALHSAPSAPKGFRMVVGGVWVSQLPLDDLAPLDLVGVICDDNLRKTADHSDIVQDVRYMRMLHAVQPHATHLLKRVQGGAYSPPRLPAVPEEEPEAEGREGPRIQYEPLPEIIAMHGPRGNVVVEQLHPEEGEPVFWCTHEVAEALKESGAADPLRFPFRLLLLTEGQANSLGREQPALQLHRLNAPSDVDFVLRVMERGQELRTLTVPMPGGRITLRLHLGGRLPAWGNGMRGLPVLIQRTGVSQNVGAVDETRVHLSKVPPYELSVPLDLPGVSLVIDSDDSERALYLNDDLAHTALDAAWKLALPDNGNPDPRLLAALLANQSLPQFSELPAPVGRTHHADAQIRLGAALPPNWPGAVREVPLVETHKGPLDLNGFLALVQSGEVAHVRDPEGFARMEPLERRFGYGCLAPTAPDQNPLFAVARIGARWVWVKDRRTYREGVWLTHLVYVARHFGPRLEDDEWETVEHPSAELVALQRKGSDALDLEEAWEELYQGLLRTEREHSWERYAFDASVDRVEGMGRLALLHLADKLGHTEDPMLLPSDGGGRWSMTRVRGDTDVSVAAANGVIVAEPRTFLMTWGEFRAVAGDGKLRLRYDDPPDVWRSLADTSDEGWLLRTEINESRLRGWLGLRLPYDGTSGILLRTTGKLVALPELDQRIPCHGLLWPQQKHHHLTQDERQLLQLAGLRMYGQLLDRMKKRMPPDEAEAVKLYAWAFCWRAHQRGRLTGTALQLSRQVEVLDGTGRTWGTLDRWLETAPERRPEAPDQVLMPPEPEAEAPEDEAIEGPRLSSLTERLNAAISMNLEVHCQASDFGRKPPVFVDTSGGSGNVVVLALNLRHDLVEAALAAPGAARELLLLEMARQLSNWGADGGRDLDLLRLHQVLLSQRFEDA